MSDQHSNPPKKSGLDHVTVDVNDLHSAIDFYRNILGLTELQIPDTIKDSGIRWFDLKNGQALHLVENKRETSADNAHFAITVEDIEAWRTYLKGISVEIVPAKIKLYNAERFFIRDPSGNRVEIVKWLE